MVDYGDGLFLDESFDLAVGADGDVAVARGASELRKDIAFRVAAFCETGRGITTPQSVASGIVGSVMTRSVRVDAENAIRSVVEGDPRVDRVTSVSIDDSVGRNQIKIDLRVIVSGTAIDVATTVGESS